MIVRALVLSLAVAASLGASAWAWDPSQAGPVTASLDGWSHLDGRHVRLYLPPGGAEKLEHRVLLAELERAVAEIAPRVPVKLARPLTVAVESDYTAMAISVGRVAPAVVGGAAEIHLVWHADDRYAYRQAVAGALLRRAGLDRNQGWWGKGTELWLSGEWFGRPYEEWLPALVAARVMPDAADLSSDEIQRDASEPLWTPAAAAVVAALGGETAKEKLSGLPGTAGVTALLAKITAAAAQRPVGSRTASPSPPFYAGISLAMLNRVDGGYHAPSLDRALTGLSGLGADSVALMPFAYQPNPRGPGLRFMNRHPASETDAGVVHAARTARSRGLTVLWKPHLWISFGSWPGDVEMESEKDWRLWWEGYRRFVLHHAFLAAWTGSETLSLGVELDRTVHRERDWRELAAAARVLFPGTLTYAGNWYEGAENVEFWDALDFVGVDAYYPLADSAAADDETLHQGAQEVVEKLARLAKTAGKPLLLTEVGFAAQRGAWVQPHSEGGEFSEADQLRAYRALLEALGHPGWLRGAFFWKAFSTPRTRRTRSDFQFLGRRAEGEIARWLTAAAGRGGGIPETADTLPE